MQQAEQGLNSSSKNTCVKAGFIAHPVFLGSLLALRPRLAPFELSGASLRDSLALGGRGLLSLVQPKNPNEAEPAQLRIPYQYLQNLGEPFARPREDLGSPYYGAPVDESLLDFHKAAGGSWAVASACFWNLSHSTLSSTSARSSSLSICQDMPEDC